MKWDIHWLQFTHLGIHPPNSTHEATSACEDLCNNAVFLNPITHDLGISLAKEKHSLH